MQKIPGKKCLRLSWGAFLLSTLASVMLVALTLILFTSQVAALSDSTPPTVSITFPGNGAWVNEIQTVSVAAIDSAGVSKVVLYVDGVLKSTDTSSPYSFSLNTGVYADSSTHTIRADAYDTSNNKASAQISVKVDNTAPTVYTTSPSNGATLSGSITWSAQASDNTGVKFVYFFVDDGLFNTILSPPYATSISTSGYSNGAHKFMVIAYDNAMNEVRHAITVYTNNPDTMPPTVTITNPAGGATVSGTTNIDVRSFDANSVKRVNYYADGTLIGTDTTLTHPDAFYYASIYWNTASVPNGSHTIVAKGYDSYNNVGTRSITVPVSNAAASDTTPPTVSIKFPGNGAWVKGATTVSVSATDTGSGIYGVHLYVDGVYKAADLASPYSFSLNTGVYAYGSTHTLKAVAYDTKFNKASAQISIKVDNKAPTVYITSPGKGATVKSTIGISVSATDTGSGIYGVYLYVDGVYKAADFTSPYRFYLDTTKYTDGTHKIRALALDKAYNYSLVEISVTISN